MQVDAVSKQAMNIVGIFFFNISRPFQIHLTLVIHVSAADIRSGQEPGPFFVQRLLYKQGTWPSNLMDICQQFLLLWWFLSVAASAESRLYT